MIRVNRQTDYAIRTLLALAKRPAGQPVSSQVVRDEMHVPPALSMRIVADLARGGFVVTHPGRTGGIHLARPAEEITLLQVVEFFEGPICISECMETGEDHACPLDTACPVRMRWGRVDALIRAQLGQIHFAALAGNPEGEPAKAAG
jgi:Rrf2 family protein